MKLTAKDVIVAGAIALAAWAGAYAQQPEGKGASAAAAGGASTASAGVAAPAIKITATTSPADLARAALAAQGGTKFRNLQSLTLLGAVDLYSPNSTQALVGKFAIVTAGDRLRQDIQSQFFNFQQIYDGQQLYSSMRGFSFPPPTEFGLGLLNKVDQTGYTVTALPDKKKQRAFRITSPQGNATDFYVDMATGRVMHYSYDYNGVSFATEHKSLKEVDGVLVPFNFSQKIGTPQGDFYAEFKVKESKVNQPIGDDVFIIPAQ